MTSFRRRDKKYASERQQADAKHGFSTYQGMFWIFP